MSLMVALIAVMAWVSRTPALASGCTPGAADKPDLGFIDSNCDGIDGDKANALFVAPSGDDNNDGSFGKPMATVGKAVTVAQAQGKDVYVAGGTYDGKVSFLSANGNIGVYGGYDPQTWQRSAANVTTLEAPGQVVGVSAPGIVLQLLSVHSTSGPTYLTSYGVRAFGTGSAALSRVSVQTAPGQTGAAGAAAPPAPAPASSGSIPDLNAPCGGNVAPAGGAGGAGYNGTLAGGNGGDMFGAAGGDGHSDPNQPTVIGGMGGPYPGQNGAAGTNGLLGKPGTGGTAALNRFSLTYQAQPGNPGTGGTRGAGGGGGAEEPNTVCVPGSGGGAGGLPGIGGNGGQGGGGSIGVFAGAGAHVLVLDASTIHTADGGKGGYGAAGQSGGPGGLGGKQLVSADGQLHNGAGGSGGYGGQGGQGGGGAGGASVGVLSIDARAVVGGDTAITVGAGGAGGTSGYNGQPGQSLKATDVMTADGSQPAQGDFDGDGIDDGTDACPTAKGTGNGCPAPQALPTGPVAGDPAATAAGGTTAGAGSVRVLPTTSCVSRTVFRIRINARKAHIKTARLTLDGRRLKLIKRRSGRWTARADLRHSSRTTHTLTIRGRLRSGKRFKQTRHYRTCA
jgi:hypothetical protein